jgi:hypothetical protein
MGAATSTVLYDSSTNWLTDLPILAGSVMTIAVPSWRVALWSD